MAGAHLGRVLIRVVLVHSQDHALVMELVAAVVGLAVKASHALLVCILFFLVLF